MKKDKFIEELDKQIKNKRSEYFCMPEGVRRAEIVNRVNGLYEAKKIFEELVEAEMPVIPQFVADWYEDHKEDVEQGIYYIHASIHDRREHFKKNLEEWFNDPTNKAVETVIRMKDGYTVEKSKMYALEIDGSPIRWERNPIYFKSEAEAQTVKSVLGGEIVEVTE